MELLRDLLEITSRVIQLLKYLFVFNAIWFFQSFFSNQFSQENLTNLWVNFSQSFLTKKPLRPLCHGYFDKK